MHCKIRWELLLLTAALATRASASVIPVINPGFEADVLTCAPGPACGTSNTLSGWVGTTADPNGFSDPNNLSGGFGAYKPSTVSYPSGIPGGSNVAYVIGVANTVSISQTLSAQLLANDTYTLTVWFGLRDDTNIYPPGLGCNGSNVALEAGGVVLNSLRNTTKVACPTVRGDFQEVTVTYTSGANPAQFGDALQIVLTANGFGSTSEPSEVDFDNVALSDTLDSASPAPEPRSFAILGSGFIALFAIRRRS